MKRALTRWTPVAPLSRDRFLGRLFEDAFNEMLRPFETETISSRSWMPPVDIRETDEALTLMLDLPGMTKDDVTVTLENDTLTVSGERKFEDEEKNDNYHRIERAYGSFSRSFNLARDTKADKVSANFANGVLEVTLPKAEESKPRHIDIG